MRLEECCADELTKRVLEKLGNDECVQWRDRDTEMTICTSKYEMLNGLLGLNGKLSYDGYATIEDYLHNDNIRNSYIIFNYDDVDTTEPIILERGWCFRSFEQLNGPVISYANIKRVFEDKDIIFEFEFFPKPCMSFYECMESGFRYCKDF